MIEYVSNYPLKESFNSHFHPSKIINQNLYNKYSKKEYSYSLICINNLMYNEYCHIVARFKDFLIYDDGTEFLNEFFNMNKLKFKLKSIFEFYSTYIHIYPNYLAIPENKFIYKNIRKKQKIINEHNQKKIKDKENKIKQKRDNSLKNTKNSNNCLNKKIILDKTDINIYINKDINISVGAHKNFIHSKSFSNINKNKIILLLNNSYKRHFESNYEKINLKRKLNKIQIKNYNQNTLYSHYSSISNKKNNEESKRSNSITEIINLLSVSDNPKTCNENNDLENKTKINFNKCRYKLTKHNKKRIKFFRLGNIGYIKKVYKTNKIQSNFTKEEFQKFPVMKNESKNNNKRNYIKNYEQNKSHKITDKNKKFHKQTIFYMEDVSKILHNLLNKNKKRKLSILKYKNNKIDEKQKDNYYKLLVIKTLYNFNKKDKLNEIKNNIRNNIKKIVTKNNNKFKNKNKTITSPNATIHLSNNLSKISRLKDIFREKEDYEIFNTTKNIMKKDINFKLMKSIDKLYISSKGKKIKTKARKEKSSNRKTNIDSDSILSTQVSLNKKYRHNSTFTGNILLKIKNNINKKSCNNNLNKNKYKNTISFSKQNTIFLSNKNCNLNEKIISYGVKPFSPNYYKISNSTQKNKKEKGRKNILKKNKIIFNFFKSKDFYNLRINAIDNKRSRESVKKKNISSNKYKDNNQTNKSISLFLKSFNKGLIHIKNYKIHKNNNNNSKINSKKRFGKEKYFYEHISLDKTSNNYFLNETQTKNNIDKNMDKFSEEIKKKTLELRRLKIK